MSTGPGSRIAHLMTIDLERPRHPGDPRLGRYFEQLEDILHTAAPSA